MPRLTPDWAAPRAVHLTSILAAGRGALLGLRADCTPRSTCGSRCLANAAPTDTSVGPRSRRADARQMEPSVGPRRFCSYIAWSASAISCLIEVERLGL